LHFQLDLRRCEAEASTPATRAALHRRLDETLAAFLRATKLPADLEERKEEFVQLGLSYLQQATEGEDPYTGEASNPGLVAPST
jgi:hypothetical protein